jgi:hypothetical protein
MNMRSRLFVERVGLRCERMLNFWLDGLSISSDGFVVEFTRTVPNTDEDLDQQFFEVSRRLYESPCLVKRLQFLMIILGVRKVISTSKRMNNNYWKSMFHYFLVIPTINIFPWRFYVDGSLST